MHKALHPRDNVDRLCVSRKRGLASIEDSVDPSMQRLEDYIEKHEGGRLQPSETILKTRWTTE